MSYQYVYPPFKHQEEGIRILRGRLAYGLFDEPGTGKSKVVVDSCNLLFLDRAISAVVVVCPNTVKGTWTNPEWGQIVTHSPEGFPFEIIRLDSGKRLPQPVDYTVHKNTRLVWVVTNYEALRSSLTEVWIQTFLYKMAPAALVLDESTKIKTRRAMQTKAVMRIAVNATRRYILTGTPIAKNPLDLYTQMNFLDTGILKSPSFVAFRNRYAKMGGYMVNGRPVQIIGWQNLDELKEKISKHTRVVEKKTALPDLPDKLYTRLEVPLSPEQERVYKQMRDTAVADIPGEIGISTARIALTKILRLTQIISGHVALTDNLADETHITVFETNPKFDVVSDLLEDVEHMVIFGMFIPEIKSLSARLTKEGVSHGLIYGETPNAEREKIQERFQAGELRVVVCQVVTGGIGITLTKGSTAVFLTNPYSHEARIQAEDRLHRPGQRANVTYYDLVATCGGKQTIDHTILKTLEAKGVLSDTVLGKKLGDLI